MPSQLIRKRKHSIFIYGAGGVGGQETRARSILVLRECIWNVPAVSLVLPAFDGTGSPGYPPHRLVYRPLVSTLMTTSCFLVKNREAELKPTSFSSLSSSLTHIPHSDPGRPWEVDALESIGFFGVLPSGELCWLWVFRFAKGAYLFRAGISWIVTRPPWLASRSLPVSALFLLFFPFL